MFYPKTRYKVYCYALLITVGTGFTYAQSPEEAAIPVRKNSEASATASATGGSAKPSVISRLQSASRGEKLPPVTTTQKPAAPAHETKKPAASGDSTMVRPLLKTVKVSAPSSKPTSAATKKTTTESTSKNKTASSASSGSSKRETRETKDTGSSKKSATTAKSETDNSSRKTTAKSTSPSKADIALVEDLQSSARSSASRNTEKSDESATEKKSSADSGDSRNSSTEPHSYVDANKNPFRNSTAGNLLNAPGTSESSENADANPGDDTAHDDSHGEEGNLASEIATVPAATSPVTAPSLYLPQPPEKVSLFSKLFGRRPAPAPRGQSTPFSSDYATRGDAILPAVIQGNGYNGRDLPIGQEDPYRFAGLTSDFRPTDLVQVPVSLCHYGNQLYLRREAANSLCNMIAAASREGLNIRVVSAYRDYGHQLRLYNQAVSRGGSNQKSVARPGRSEHHLGTTVDLTNNETHALKRSFGNTPEGQWLAANAHRYGWKLTVMSENARRSHNEEPWHLRYLGSHVNSPTGISNVANANPRPQRRSVLGSVSRMLHLGRN